jgi:hypothetical protein
LIQFVASSICKTRLADSRHVAGEGLLLEVAQTDDLLLRENHYVTQPNYQRREQKGAGKLITLSTKPALRKIM